MLKIKIVYDTQDETQEICEVIYDEKQPIFNLMRAVEEDILQNPHLIPKGLIFERDSEASGVKGNIKKFVETFLWFCEASDPKKGGEEFFKEILSLTSSFEKIIKPYMN